MMRKMYFSFWGRRFILHRWPILITVSVVCLPHCVGLFLNRARLSVGVPRNRYSIIVKQKKTPDSPVFCSRDKEDHSNHNNEDTDLCQQLPQPLTCSVGSLAPNQGTRSVSWHQTEDYRNGRSAPHSNGL